MSACNCFCLPAACSFLASCFLLVASWRLVSCFLPLVACNCFLLLASSFLFSCFLPLLLVMTSWPLLLVIPPLTRSPCCKRGRRILCIYIYMYIYIYVYIYIYLYIPVMSMGSKPLRIIFRSCTSKRIRRQRRIGSSGGRSNSKIDWTYHDSSGNLQETHGFLPSNMDGFSG